MFDIITIGSATRDVFVKSSEMQIVKNKRFKTGRGACFSLGSKIEAEEVHFTTGGSAINTAITFAQQGLQTGVICKIGDDRGGEAILERLREVRARLLTKPQKNAQTAYSVILTAPAGGERSILVYRSIAQNLEKQDVFTPSLAKTKWFYITHLGGRSAKIFASLILYAAKNNIRIALNPGKTQLALGKKLVPLLKYVDVFIVNSEEASYLTGTSLTKEGEVFHILNKWVRHLAVMTKGPKGVEVSDGVHHWRAPILKEPKIVDRTGAGDAFGSGFVAALVRGRSVEDAIQLGSANATAGIGEWGANYGLLKRRDSVQKFGKLKVIKT